MKTNSYRCLLLVATTLIILSSAFPGVSGEIRPVPQEAGEILRNLKAGPWSQGSVDDDGNILKVLINDPDGERLAELAHHFPTLKLVFLGSTVNLSPQDLRHLRSLTNLESLWVGGVITNEWAQGISSLTDLRELMLRVAPSQTMTEEGVRPLSHLKQMESLYLVVSHDNSKPAADKLGAAVLRQFPELIQLRLGGSGASSLTMREIGRLTQLSSLAFEGWGIAANDFRHLQGLTRLESIQGLPGEAAVYCASLTTLNSISDLWGITDDGMRHLSSLANLRQLRITSEDITDASLVHLKSLSNLESLELYSPKIVGSGFAHLDQLKKVRRLKLRRTNFQPENIHYLARMTGLEDLDLGWTPIGSKRSLDSLKVLKELPRLKTLQFEGANENQEMFKAILPGVTVHYLE